MHKLDVRGLCCPLPVLEVQRAVQAGQLPLAVEADGGAPRENIRRLATKLGLTVKEEKKEASYLLTLSR